MTKERRINDTIGTSYLKIKGCREGRDLIQISVKRGQVRATVS